MIAYFKYTNGEAFKLGGVSYVGYFNISEGVPYTGKIKTDNSEELTPNDNFISEFYIKKLNFDNQFGNIPSITPAYANNFDIFNNDGLSTLLESINNNNLLVFKSLVMANPEIIEFDDNDSHYYGLSSTPIDTNTDDLMFSKEYISHIDPFLYSPQWGFLENIICGDFIVKSNQDFIYLCSDGTTLYTVRGSFSESGEMSYTSEELILGLEIYEIYYDDFDNKIVIIENDLIKIYDGLNFIQCGELILIDSIKLSNDNETIFLTWGLHREFGETYGKFNKKFYNINENIAEYMKFGKNYRTSVEDNVLSFYNKYSESIIRSITLTDYEISNFLNIDIRNVDDHVAILHKSDLNEYKITFFDPEDVDNTIITHDLKNVEESDNYRVTFSSYDSNIFYFISNDQADLRYVSAPSWSTSNFKENNLKYPENWEFDNLYQKFGDSTIKWNTKALDSNIFKNKIFNTQSKSNKNYILLHNSGRIYPLKQPIMDAYSKAIGLDLEKNYKGIVCSDHSFGLFFNKTISSILNDVLLLYTNASNSYGINEDGFILNKIGEITYDVNNLYMNGNETVNVIVIQRIVNILIELQKKLLANLTTNP